MPPTPGEENSVEAAYDRWAESYDSAPNATRDLDAVALRAQPLALAGADVLEVGCGTGKNTGWLAMEARSVLAMDFSRGMLSRARGRVRSERVQFVRADLRTPWPVADQGFDVVVADLVLEHLEHLGPFFREAARVLRDRGRLFVCELHPVKQLLGSQARFAAPETGEVVLVPAHLHSVSEYLNAGIEAGLRLARAEEWREEAAPPASPPRLLSLLWHRS
jgi:malonyl-CoA O-methyltransferase